MLDASDSVGGEANFKLAIQFIITVFRAFTLGGGIRFAFVIFGSSAQVVFDFSKYTSMSEVEAAMGQVALVSGSCTAGAALSTCQSSLFASGGGGGGAGAGASARLLVVMIAGKSSDSVSAGSTALKGIGVKMICVGMGASYDREQVTTMTSESEYAMFAASFGELSGMSASMISLIGRGECQIYCILYFYIFVSNEQRLTINLCDRLWRKPTLQAS